MIMTGATYGWHSWLCPFARDRVSDLDRILHILQGLPYPGKENDAGAAVERACRNGEATIDTEWLHVKIFQNGNLYIYIRDKNLINSVNRIIAEHYGETLPTQKRHQFKHY